MASSNQQYVTISNSHIDSLIDYVLDVKPYHAKLSEITEQYLFEDSMAVTIADSKRTTVLAGADLIAGAQTSVRSKKSNSWYKELTSDGSRRTWPVPMSAVHKFLASHCGQQKFVIGPNSDHSIPGLTTAGPASGPQAVAGARRWDGPGISSVTRNGQHQQESLEYFLSHGAFTFDLAPEARWRAHDLSACPQFPLQPGALQYADVSRSYGIIKNITGGNYEEWTLTCTRIESSGQPAQISISGSVSGLTGTCEMGSHFSGVISFDFENAPALPGAIINVGDQFILTPANKITVNPSAPIETWSLIKTNPIINRSIPQWQPADPTRTDLPALDIHTRPMDPRPVGALPNETWRLDFVSPSIYNLWYRQGSGPDQHWDQVDLRDGCSYSTDRLSFTLVPTTHGFEAGDQFTWFLGNDRIDNYLVFGSVSGWQTPAKIGEWYWNGKIGFKIPKLEYSAKAYNSTIVSSTDAAPASWTAIISNSQILRSVFYDSNHGVFMASGAASIVAASSDGVNWTSDIFSVVTPVGNELIILTGESGLVAISRLVDGEWQFVSQVTHTSRTLHGSTQIPHFLTSSPTTPTPGDLNCIIVVGAGGTILTSIGGIGWAHQTSGTTSDLYDITWSPDAIIAVGSGGTVLRSLDRTTWTACASSTTANLKSIIYDATTSAFIAVGSGGTIIRSTDGGLTWHNLAQFSSGNFTDVVVGADEFVAVSDDGWVARSTDGEVWTRYIGPRLNSIAFGKGRFIGVGGRETEYEQFVPLKPVHDMAEPSVYTVTFVTATRATVFNNLYGYGASLTVGQPWSDQFASFRLDPLPFGFQYSIGDTVKVYMAPMHEYAIRAGYDQTRYDMQRYDTSIVDMISPLVYNTEIFPLYHAHGLVIFPSATVGDHVVVDRAVSDVVRMNIAHADSSYPELASQGGWIPLEFRYSDRAVGGVPTSPAEFSDQATLIEAYLCSDRSQKVFTIAQPRHAASNLYDGAQLTIDPAFFAAYLPFNTRFVFQFKPDSPYGQTIRVKITENLHTYVRARLNFDDIITIHVHDSTISSIEIIEDIEFFDHAHFALVDHNPHISIDSTPPHQTANTAFAEGLTIVEAPAPLAPATRVSMTYDVTRDTAAGGLLITQSAPIYLITHNGPATTPSLIVESLSNPGVYGNPTANRYTYDQVPTAISRQSFSFSLPPGFSVPFKLTVI